MPELPRSSKLTDRAKAELAEYGKRLGRLKRIEEVLACEGWNNDILPLIRDRIQGRGRGAAWSPTGKADCQAIALGAAYNGGAADELEILLNQISAWVEDGRKAIAVMEGLKRGSK